MNRCGLVQLVCSVPACETPFEVMSPTTEDLYQPLCPQHKKARLVEKDETRCDQVGDWIAGR